MTWLVGNPRFSLVVENRFWLVNGAGPIRPWSDFVGCDHVSHGWEQWGVSRTRLSWSMCWVLGAWFNMAKNVVLLCKVPVDKRCVLSWTVCDYLCWPYCAVFALIFNPFHRSYEVIRVVFRFEKPVTISFNFNDVRKRLWKLIWLARVLLLEIRVD